MTDPAFDTTPLAGRVRPWARWREFRAEAIAGEHGQDLGEARWWHRSAYLMEAVGFAVFIPAVPVVLLIEEGPTLLAVAASILWGGTALFAAVIALWWMRHDHWGARARRRFKLTEFASRNGLTYEPEADVGQLAAHIFDRPPKWWHRDRIIVPGPRGFTVADYQETWDDGPGEPYGSEYGYVVFGLSESYPRTLVARSIGTRVKALAAIEPVAGPAGTQVASTKPEHAPLRRLLDSGVVERSRQMGFAIEIVGNELFVLHGGNWSMTSPRLWQQLESVAEAIAPFLAVEANRGADHGARQI